MYSMYSSHVENARQVAHTAFSDLYIAPSLQVYGQYVWFMRASAILRCGVMQE